MKKKLTLTVDESVIEMAKAYAEAQQVSLSAIFEKVMAEMAAPFRKKPKKKEAAPPESIHTDVEKLKGVLTLPPDFDEKEARRQYLAEKYA